MAEIRQSPHATHPWVLIFKAKDMLEPGYENSKPDDEVAFRVRTEDEGKAKLAKMIEGKRVSEEEPSNEKT